MSMVTLFITPVTKSHDPLTRIPARGLVWGLWVQGARVSGSGLLCSHSCDTVSFFVSGFKV